MTKSIFKKLKLLIYLYTFFLFFAQSNALAKDKELDQIVELKELVAKPKDFLNKKLTIEGDFYSFSSLSLDYKKALRESKDFIGIILSRPDKKDIPLVELKISAPLELFKNEDISIDHGDKLRLNTKVYAVALGEPWLELKDLEIIKKVEKEE